MIDISKYPILNNHQTTLRKTSKDDNNKNNIEFMTESKLRVINFDTVAREYARKHKLKGIPTSNDALFISSDGRIWFIEFKNGVIDKETQYNIKYKIFDSVFILTDILEENICFSREKVEYVLVYNNKKNSKTLIADYISKKANTHFIEKGLEKFKGYCLRDVYTYTKEEFEENFVKKYEQNEDMA